MKIFLTGCTGFIGSHFINNAFKAGYDLLCLKRKDSSPRIKLSKEPNWIVGNLDDKFDKNIFNDIDIFVHLAAQGVTKPDSPLEDCLHWNVSAPLNLFKSAFDGGVTNFIVAGSCFEYGLSGNRYAKIPIDAPLLPMDNYSISKAVSSIVFTGWARQLKIKLKYFRIFHVYGEGEKDSRFWPSLRKAALSGNDFSMTPGDQIRDFIKVGDLADILVKELDFSDVKTYHPQIKNIGSGKEKTLKEFAEFWWKYWQAKGQLKFGDIPYRKKEVMRYVPLLNNYHN